jgi:hypothetical protein
MWPEVAKLTLVISAIVALMTWMVSRGAPDSFPAAKRRWKVLLMVSWVVGMTGMLASVVLLEGYRYPVKPDPETARIYAYNLHGTKIYLTKEEDLAIDFFEMISFVAIVALFVNFYIMQTQQQTVDDQKYE